MPLPNEDILNAGTAEGAGAVKVSLKETEDIKRLIRNRGTIKYKLTILEKFVNTIKTSLPPNKPSFIDVDLRYKNGSVLLQEFDQVESLIESLCEEDEIDIHHQERDEFQERFYKVQSFLVQYLQQEYRPLAEANPVNASQQVNNSSTSFSSQNVDSLQNVLLPKLKLPTFSGNFDEWINFKVNFISIIADNTSLSECQKFQFLKSSLGGYASRFVDGLDGVDKPYSRAWQILCDKFDKKQFLLDSHFQSLLKLPQINKENFFHCSKMLDELTKHLAAIDAMKLSMHKLFDSFIIHLMSNKLDKTTFREWKELDYEDELPTLDEFMDFIKNKVDLLQSLEQSFNVNNSGYKPTPHVNNNNYKHHSRNKFDQSNVNFTSSSALYTVKCNFCGSNHTIYKCQEFLKLAIKDRLENVKRLNLCRNCLRTGHAFDKCNLQPCKTCKSQNKIMKHNSLLHFDIQQNYIPDTTQSQPETNFNALVRPETPSQTQVILSTIVCRVQDFKGNFHKCRALLDSGAQSNLISESFCNKLNLQCSPANLSIIGITQVVSQLKKKCTISVHSNSSNFKCSILCFVTPIITSNIPFQSIDITNWSIPNHVQLADPEFNICREVDLLIGANIFWELILEGKIQLGNNLPTLQNTRFGYIATGSYPILPNNTVCNFTKVHIPEDDQLKKFWELEEVSLPIPPSHDDIECEKLFERDTFRNEQGQFVVKFPLKYPSTMLGDSKEVAAKRFLSLEKKFINLEFKKLYFDFMEEYEFLGHMTKLPIQENNSDSYFLPHHGVLKQDSITTKLRTVFDGSCSTSTGWSLNDLQYVGPKVQNNIIDILLRFRTYTYVVSADVSKMYRCILMHPDHRPLQQILWRDDFNKAISTYQLNTVSYGTTSAPYLAIKCLKRLASDNSVQFPKASETILKDFYVDDLLTGSNDINKLNVICHQISSILSSAHFILRKWVSNDQAVLNQLNDVSISNSTLSFGKNESCKTLGIQWVPNSDNLKYSIKQFCNNKDSITKRYILSTIAQIYDPLGLLSPIIIVSKTIIQKLWSLRIPWDSSIPPDLEKNFIRFQNNLDFLNNLKIFRNTIPKGYNLFDVHCFCDASKDAYAACIYLRSKTETGDFQVHLLCAKSKVAPLKIITIPKLELCASLLGAQLTQMVMNAIPISVPVIMWTDSQVALSWIKTEPSRLQVFVSNRVAKIQSLTELNNWKYVNTKENPADLASRGVSSEQLINNSLWWTGRQFLREGIVDWPNERTNIPLCELPEITKTSTSSILKTTVIENFNLFSRFSSFHKLQRITALCIRFSNNLNLKRQNKTLQCGPITISELDNARAILIRLAQYECFLPEIQLLKKTSPLNKKHKLSSLTPFIDNMEIIRVGGRLKNTYLPYDIKHPILLDGNHPLTKLIFEFKHKQLLHPGPQHLLASVRQFYWATGGRNLAKKVTKNCLTCFKFKPEPAVCPMSALPDNRIKPNLPFQTTGLDYAGPFFILNKPGRGSRLIKCYLAVFVCFCTKAIHLEIVSNLTTENFLAALRRFTSRRGVPSSIYSDNGTTFVGANNELKNLGYFLHNNLDSITDLTSQDKINWVFIPPYTPNFGGLWEAAVKSAKHHLKRALINRNVTYEEFNTLVIEVEGILNSRPLFFHVK